MTMDRRRFLQGMGYLGAMALAPMAGLRQALAAAEPGVAPRRVSPRACAVHLVLAGQQGSAIAPPSLSHFSSPSSYIASMAPPLAVRHASRTWGVLRGALPALPAPWNTPLAPPGMAR